MEQLSVISCQQMANECQVGGCSEFPGKWAGMRKCMGAAVFVANGRRASEHL